MAKYKIGEIVEAERKPVKQKESNLWNDSNTEDSSSAQKWVIITWKYECKSIKRWAINFVCWLLSLSGTGGFTNHDKYSEVW